MQRHLSRELDKIKKKILSLGAMVEESLEMAAQATTNRDHALAEQISARDQKIDEFEVEIEEDCLKAIALNQPVAVDLRFLASVIKINSELERIGDEAVNVAERVFVLARYQDVPMPVDFHEMYGEAQEMLKLSLDSLVNLDSDLAYKVLVMDDPVDEMNRAHYEICKNLIARNPAKADFYIAVLSISRHLERIADHSTNIAEDVIYMIEGLIHRHMPMNK